MKSEYITHHAINQPSAADCMIEKIGIAKIFHSPQIPQDELRQFVIDKFHLTQHNGIKKIKMIADGSERYKCYLDEM